MNLISKCNCCLCEPVCKYKSVYQKGIDEILNTTIPGDTNNSFWKLKDCPHIEVSIKCPHMVTSGAAKRSVMTEGEDETN